MKQDRGTEISARAMGEPRRVALWPWRSHITTAQRDLMTWATAEGREPKRTGVHEVTTSELIACCEDQESADAVRLMQERQIRHLAVLSAIPGSSASSPCGVWERALRLMDLML